jgi:hypothetical protein
MEPLDFTNLNPRASTHRGLADPSIGDFTQSPLEELSFNPVKHHEHMVAGTLRADAGSDYDSNGFSRRTLREITADLEHDGFRPGAIILPAGGRQLFDGVDLNRQFGDAGSISFYGWDVVELETDAVLDCEGFVVGEDALSVPEFAPAKVLVRHPRGVAHYRFGGE